jgi:deoxyribonuclease-4
VLHINDSINECGAHKDRHANIGYGKIGFNNISGICHMDKFKNVPKILETPVYENELVTYKKEVEMINENKFIS